MEYISRTVRSRPGLSHEAALESLQDHPNFVNGTKIKSFRRRGDRWVAALEVPKTAGPFPPSDDGDEGGPPPKEDSGEKELEKAVEDDEASDEDSDSGDGPPSPPGAPGEEGGEKGKGGTEGQILHVLEQILHALSGGPPMGGPGGPDDLGPGAPPPGGPPPHGGPPGGPGAKPMGAGRPMKPGEMPNKPGVVPVGAPAFASTREANPALPGGMGATPGNPGSVPNPGQMTPGNATCPGCGGKMGPDGVCPTCTGAGALGAPGAGGMPGAAGGGMGMMSPLASKLAQAQGRIPTLVVSASEGMTIKQAKSQLEPVANQFGYEVAQIKYVDGKPRALLTVR